MSMPSYKRYNVTRSDSQKSFPEWKVFCCSNNMTIKSFEDLLESSNNLVTPVYFPLFYNSGIFLVNIIKIKTDSDIKQDKC